MTVAFAMFSFFALPNYPHNTFWLKGEERAVAIWRLVRDNGAHDTDEENQVSMLAGFKMAVRDYKTWFLVANHSLITTGAGIVVFYPTVVGTLGFNRSKCLPCLSEVEVTDLTTTEITYALVAPPYMLAFVTTVYGCYLSGKKNEKTWHMITTMCVTLVGLIILASTLNVGARYFSLFLVTCFVYISYNCNLAWSVLRLQNMLEPQINLTNRISACMPRPAAKRAAAIGLVNMIGQSG